MKQRYFVEPQVLEDNVCVGIGGESTVDSIANCVGEPPKGDPRQGGDDPWKPLIRKHNRRGTTTSTFMQTRV